MEKIESDKRYRHLLTLSYNDIVPFVIEHIKKCTLPVVLSLFAIVLSIIPMVLCRIELTTLYPWFTIFTYSVTGFVLIPFLLILPHEFLHIIPYFFSGARDIRIGARWSEAYFYVTADKHPVNARWFMAIALTPALTISLLLLILSFSLSPLWQWSIYCSLFMHLTMCAGDLALINFYYLNREKTIITWDDTEKGEALFYEELNIVDPGAHYPG